jgi:hypothetical protein
MYSYVGIWIDRRKAHIVELKKILASDGGYRQTIETIESQVEPRVRLSGGSRSRKTPWGPQDVAVDGKSAARRKRQLADYFKSVLANIKSAQRIIIMGPGETKHQLRTYLDQNKDTAGKVIMVETVDKLTEKQLAARVRHFYEIERHSR